MATITTINGSDYPKDSRAVINTNFANLNSDKIETSVISTDGTLADNSDTEIPSEKAVKTYVDATVTQVSVESTAAATHSLTTVADQVVMVIAKGVYTGESTEQTVTLAYNGVAKDTVVIDADISSERYPFTLVYTETPGAATANITLTASSGTINQPVIMVQKIG